MQVSGQLHGPAIYPRGDSPMHPLDRRLGGPQSRSGRSSSSISLSRDRSIVPSKLSFSAFGERLSRKSCNVVVFPFAFHIAVQQPLKPLWSCLLLCDHEPSQPPTVLCFMSLLMSLLPASGEFLSEFPPPWPYRLGWRCQELKLPLASLSGSWGVPGPLTTSRWQPFKRVWTLWREKSRPCRESNPGRPARSTSLYRLGYLTTRICPFYISALGNPFFNPGGSTNKWIRKRFPLNDGEAITRCSQFL
jgi:hypothetical protein